MSGQRQIAGALGHLKPIAGTGENVTITSPALTLSSTLSAVHADCTHIEITCYDNAVVYTRDGTTPVGGGGAGGKGIKLAVDEVLRLTLEELNTVKFIRDGGTDGYIWTEQFTWGD